MKPEPQMNRYFYIAGWILMALFAMGAAVIHIKGKTILNYVPPCMFHRVTGYYCPGCGGTRAVFTFFRGDIVRAFKFHPFVPYNSIIGGWFMLSQTIQRLSGDRIKIGMNFRIVYLWIALGIIALNWIIKNMFILVCGIHLLD